MLNPGGHLVSSPVRNQVTTLVPFYSLHSHRVIKKVAIETGFLSIPTTKESDKGGEEATFSRGTWLIFWPRGQVRIWGRVLIRAWALTRGNSLVKTMCM